MKSKNAPKKCKLHKRKGNQTGSTERIPHKKAHGAGNPKKNGTRILEEEGGSEYSRTVRNSRQYQMKERALPKGKEKENASLRAGEEENCS